MNSEPSIVTIPKGETWGIVMSAVGILIITASFTLQYYIIDHGSSNQITIDNEMQKNVYIVLTGIVLFIVGFVLWLWFSAIKNKYMATFLVAFISFAIANTAVLLSLYQVTVTKS
jgi:hypothetical protein